MVEPGQPLFADLEPQLLLDLPFALRPELQRHELGGPRPDAMGDVVAGDVEDLAVVGNAPKHHVSVGMPGVVMVDRDPVELGLEVLLHLRHQPAGEVAQVAHVGGVLGRDDEAELGRSSRPRARNALPSAWSSMAE